MEKNEKTIEILNDLIRINNDRVEGYEKAVKDTREQDTDLRNMFNRMADESRNYTRELTEQVQRAGGEPASDATVPGKIYRVWMDVKSSVTGHGRESVLELCEFGEDAAQKAYKKALEADENVSSDVQSLIRNQQEALKSSHDTIKQYRDMQHGANRVQ
jgi:uncharacterized protein (TIGR02284 family)